MESLNLSSNARRLIDYLKANEDEIEECLSEKEDDE